MPTTPHPGGHPPGELTQTAFDVVVVGGGSTGQNVAEYAGRDGLSVVVVEDELVGGDCSYWACMPSKALLRPVEALASAQAVAGSREAVTGRLDADAVLARRDEFTHGWDDASQVGWLGEHGIALVRGRGRLTGARTVQVTGHDGDTVTLTARQAVAICTGSRPSLPPVDGLDGVGAWTSRDATSAKEAPRRLAIVGGGVVGVEMATAWSALGSETVVVLQRGPRLLPGNEPEVGERVASALRERGVDVRLGSDVRAARRDDDGAVVLTTGDGEVVADEVLVAAGRAPRTDDLGLETVGLPPGDWLDTDDTLLVAGLDGGWLYAAGDVTHRALLTHQGKYQGRACGCAIAARARGAEVTARPWTDVTATADAAAVPQVVFTEPQVAAVGLTERQARDAGHAVETVEYPLGSVAGASLLADGYDGWAKLVVDADADVLLGATFVGSGVAELLHSATVAVVGQVPLGRLWHAVPAYPTMSEVWLRLLETLRAQRRSAS